MTSKQLRLIHRQEEKETTKYQKYLRIIGWICVAMAVITGVAFVLSGQEASMEINGEQVNAGLAAIVAAVIIAAGYLLLAWLCMRGTKDASKVGPIRILSLIVLVFSVLDLLGNGIKFPAGIDNLISVVVSGVTFFVANKVKQGE